MNKEWENEPNGLVFWYKDYQCIINRNRRLKTLCGYVFIVDTNKNFIDPKEIDGELYDHEDLMKLEVHGGITYGEYVKMGCDKGMIIGFDCAHAYDLSPALVEDGFEYLSISGFEHTYKNIAFVENEIKKLVDQLEK